MTDRTTSSAFDFHPERPIHATFDAPETSSDGGLLLLRQAEERLGLIKRFAAHVPDDRDSRRVEHDREEQVRQRVFQIAMGYEDCNDASTLRQDPMFKVVCDRAPQSERGLSSQPTLSRFENAVTGRALRRLLQELEDSYVDGLPPDTQVVILDIDSTDDETHGSQQLTFFHGFYDQHMYHPLLVFDGDGQLITALLRPGNAHAARSACSTLRRVIKRIKARFPRGQIVVRADSGFCVPKLLDMLEELDGELGDIDYIIGLAKNSVLLRLAAPVLAQAQERFASGVRHVRHFDELSYAAQTWKQHRRVIVKAEHHERGPNPRFVVTSLLHVEPRTLYDVGYCARGQSENYIKDLKNALLADRLSCSQFIANFFRLLLHAVAYRLLFEVRCAARAVNAPTIAALQFDTLRLRLLKVAAHVTQSARRLLVRLPKAFPLASIFAAIASALAPATPPPVLA
jgi:hypothetical protein